jgi:hypothetical protein
MASTYSTLKVELIGTGDQTGTWGTTTNDNLSVALGEAITGSADVAFSSADVTVTLTDTNAAQTARNLRLNLTGTSGGARNLILGSGCQIEKLYLINNGLADAVTVKNTSGTGIAVAAGKSMFVYNNGTNVVDAVTHLSSLTLGTALPVASGGTGSTSTTFVNLASNVTGVLPIANGGTGASSSPAAAFALKGANSDITSLTNLTTALSVGQGGTGQSTYTDGQLLIGNTSTTGLAKATLTQGSGISITNGAGTITIASTASGGPTGAFAGMQVFNSPGTFTAPANTTSIYVVAAGGGGGGGGAGNGFDPENTGKAGQNGGGGAVGVGVFPVAASSPHAVTVGSQGNGGGPNGAGNAGGATSIGNLLTCNGGNGGGGGGNSGAPNPGPAGSPGNAPLANTAVGAGPSSGATYTSNAASGLLVSNTAGASGSGAGGGNAGPGPSGGGGSAGKLIVYF